MTVTMTIAMVVPPTIRRTLSQSKSQIIPLSDEQRTVARKITQSLAYRFASGPVIRFDDKRWVMAQTNTNPAAYAAQLAKMSSLSSKSVTAHFSFDNPKTYELMAGSKPAS